MSGAAKYLQAPRVAKVCPVSCVRARTVRMNGGAYYGRSVWIVSDHLGHLVELIEGDDSAESRVFARWPWFSTHEAGRYPAIVAQTWPLAVNVAPSEFRRLVGLEPWSENAAKLRTGADARERYSAVCDALNRVLIDGNGTHPLDGAKSAVIYHRTRAHGGDHASEHLRAAMRAFVRAGIVELVGDPNATMPDGKTRAADYVGSYRATDSTPAYR